MGFADPAQILVSRSYYDAVSRLSPQYAGMFHYQGSRTDKHVREHEVYAIGYPGDKTTHGGTIRPEIAGQAGSSLASLISHAKAGWYSIVTMPDGLIAKSIARYRESGSKQRVLYVGIVAVPLLLLVVLLAKLSRHDAVPVAPPVVDKQTANMIQPVSAVVSVTPVSADSGAKSKGATSVNAAPSKHRAKKTSESKEAKDKHSIKDGHPKEQPNTNSHDAIEKSATVAASSEGSGAHVIVSCREGAEVFIDGTRKGRIGSKPLTIEVSTGPHTVIVSLTSGGIYKQNVELNSGKTVHIKPSFCD
jgi:hypothetical protein